MNTFVAATTPPQVVGMESHSSSTSDNNDDKRKEEEEGEETPVAAGSQVTTPPGIQPSPAVKCKRDQSWRRNFISSSNKNKNKNKNKKANKDPSNWEQQVGDEDLLGDVHGCCCLPNRIFWKGSLDSQGCPPASTEEVKEIFYHSFMILGAYAKNLEELTKLIREHHPTFDPHGVVEFQHPQEHGACPPYFIYLSHERKELAMYIRGLQLLHRRDYVTLMNNRKDEQPFDGGYVHHGMYQPAEWSAKHITPKLKELLLANKGYRFTNVGHSLGAGVAPLFTILLVKNPELIGGISPELIHSYGFAPPRVMSLDLSIKYAPYITSCVYQDDFFPRVSTASMKKLFVITFALTAVVVFILWVKQAFQITHSDDPRRLYPPGKICHFVYKQPGRQGHHPIRARIVPSSQGRFERLVLSSSGTTKNHFVLSLCEHLKTYNWPEDLKDPWLVDVLSTRKEKVTATLVTKRKCDQAPWLVQGGHSCTWHKQHFALKCTYPRCPLEKYRAGLAWQPYQKQDLHQEDVAVEVPKTTVTCSNIDGYMALVLASGGQITTIAHHLWKMQHQLSNFGYVDSHV